MPHAGALSIAGHGLPYPPDMMGREGTPWPLMGSPEVDDAAEILSFEVYLHPCKGKQVGLDVVLTPGSGAWSFVIERVTKGGRVDIWNQANELPYKVLPGDHIVEVNDFCIWGNLPRMAEQFSRTNEQLRMKVQRYPRSFSSEAVSVLEARAKTQPRSAKDASAGPLLPPSTSLAAPRASAPPGISALAARLAKEELAATMARRRKEREVSSAAPVPTAPVPTTSLAQLFSKTAGTAPASLEAPSMPFAEKQHSKGAEEKSSAPMADAFGLPAAPLPATMPPSPAMLRKNAREAPAAEFQPEEWASLHGWQLHDSGDSAPALGLPLLEPPAPPPGLPLLPEAGVLSAARSAALPALGDLVVQERERKTALAAVTAAVVATAAQPAQPELEIMYEAPPANKKQVHGELTSLAAGLEKFAMPPGPMEAPALSAGLPPSSRYPPPAYAPPPPPPPNLSVSSAAGDAAQCDSNDAAMQEALGAQLYLKMSELSDQDLIRLLGSALGQRHYIQAPVVKALSRNEPPNVGGA